ncbi:proton-conducting transporter membrane subunit [Meiothermus rufus]|uniref:proton-conducting transporter transmembrane domain-containing protein n=1 Tax=Meiothermus rufus TaxID=604332 RepID=UPI0003F9936C|nr:proton-conducting transporter membrane subunit [Meiothermus rufus]
MTLIYIAFGLLGGQSLLALLAPAAYRYLPLGLGGSGLLLALAGLPAWLGQSSALPLDATAGFYLALLGALYLGVGFYLRDYLAHHPGPRARLETLLLPLFAGSMAGVVLAPLGYSFLFLWEGMALLGYLLIALEGPAALAGSRAFFLASRVSGAGLFLALLLLIQGGPREGLVHLVWAGLVLGFGTKAALFPLHAWLPKAHPVAMSPLSALLSGGMVKLGLYGLYRALDWAGPAPAWVGWLLLGLGLAGAVYALVLGLAENDYKGVLAYSSVENLNLLLAALGGYFLLQHPFFLLAFFFHQAAHALFKGLLFLGSGALKERGLSALGGLFPKLPQTAAYSLLAAAVGAGLPPLAGFLGEWYLYQGFLSVPKGGVVSLLALGVGVLALVGALAAALYVRLLGLAFLGLPRSSQALEVHEVGLYGQVGLGLLALGLVGLSLFPGALLAPLNPPLYPVALLALGLLGLGGGLVYLLQRKPWRSYTPWDCGYNQPGQPGSALSPRMQPNALGYSEQLLRLFPFVEVKIEASREGLLHPPTLRWQGGDWWGTLEALFARGYLFLARQAQRLQSGSLHLYLLLQFLALLFVLGVSWQ